MNLSRRTFLKTSALGFAASTFSARSWAQVAGANSEATLVETYADAGPGDGKTFTNTVTEVGLGDNASLHHYREIPAHSGHVDERLELRRGVGLAEG